MEFDFIIIGGGLAGLTSALTLEKYGHVLLVSKKKLTDCASNLAQGGIAAVVSPNDSFISHVEDTFIAGSHHNKKDAVEFLVKNGPKAIRFLEREGVVFDTQSGSFDLGREGGHTRARVVHASDFTGKVVEATLIKRVKERENISIWENCFATDLLVDKSCCLGVKVIKNAVHPQSLHRRGSPYMPATPEVSLGLINCFARATILATGGLGQVYEWTTNPEIATGDGIAMAYRAGAELSDLEFIQFHPTALKQGKSPLFLLSEALRGEGAYLVKRKGGRGKGEDKSGERFMWDYDERLELSPRDIVARAIFNEQKKGFEVYLDIRRKKKNFIEKRFPNICKELQKRGYDLARDLIPVTPAAHYSCGGVKVDLFGRTSIDNLFAFGEVACTGVHGANRLASNSLLEAIVFPMRLKDCISQMLSHSGKFRPSRDASRIRLGSWSHPDGIGIPQDDSLRNVKLNLQHLMWEKAGIVRTKKGLAEALLQLEKWKRKLDKIRNFNIELAEIRNMVLTAKLITEAALKREKSLGAHYIIPEI